MLHTLLNPMLELDSYKKIIESNNKDLSITPVLATGVIDVQKCHLINCIQRQLDVQTLIVTHNELKAKEIYEDMSFFLKENVMLYPSKDIIFYSADVHSIEIINERLKVVNALMDNKKITVVLSVEALFNKMLKRDNLQKFILHYKVGDVVKFESMANMLVNIGYERCEVVESKGQFSARGGILDVYSTAAKNAVRIEFFDDEIDSIRVIDTITQRSVEKIDSVIILPTREIVYDDKEFEDAVAEIKKDYSERLRQLEALGLEEEAKNIKSSVGNSLARLEENRNDISKFIAYFCKDTVTLLDYFNKDAFVVFDEPYKVKEHAEIRKYESDESIKNHILKGYMLPQSANMMFSYDDVIKASESYFTLLCTNFSQSVDPFKVKETVNFKVRSAEVFKGKVELLLNELKNLKEDGFRILVLSGSRMRAERLSRELFEMDIDAPYIENIEQDIKPSQIVISKGSLSKGFIYEDIKFAVISDREIFGEEKKVKKRKTTSKIESFTDLKINDFVVHNNYGIGIYKGIDKVTLNGISRDFIKIGYANESNVYIPVNQMDLIQRYIGGESAKLNKIGSTDWEKSKGRVKKAVADLAKSLVVLYAKRQETKGYQFSKDTVWQREFEELFKYEETDDQLAAIDDVKKDMESDKVMDRLICGDVGYGKTEVAIRAAFKAVQDGKQVAYLVPTTILAEQHFTTFQERMANFPIVVESLSRFRTAKDQKRVISGLSRGLVDIVVGTHRILSADMKFTNLGLVIVDEEQRFGVTQKEKLKHLAENVDVLTLTATPIPRTLHLSMTGIRDLSLLEEPPQERHPIQTYVMEYNTAFIRDAVLREVNRGGQVYYLNNRVRNIELSAGFLRELIPEARIEFAHGRMSERELERIMYSFIKGEIDMLVCTTIIETGLDIPNVNTIIIQDADRMGLSQLYQLRGRVGRSNKLAYAYLMYKKDKVLNEEAEKRLQTIREFTEFGSGFKIALRDMEIRGAGSLLGAEQHGHMDTVGYDMYCKLLAQAVDELRGAPPKTDFETTIDVFINAFIPNYYISDEETKLDIYKKIASIKDIGSYNDVEEEIEDRFGDIPKSVSNLLLVSILKATANKANVSSITQKKDSLIIYFRKIEDTDKIVSAMKANKDNLFYTASETPYLTFKIGKNDIEVALRVLKNILETLA